MKVCYLDLNFPDLFEDYSYTPRRYGGGRVMCAAALQRWDNLHIYADNNCFDNIKDEKILKKCFPLSEVDREEIRGGAPIEHFIKDAESYDLFFHHHINIPLNLEGLQAKTAAWSVGVYEHNYNENLLLYSRTYQKPHMFVNKNVYDIVIGKYIRPFELIKKDFFLFQCSRHNPQFGTAITASWCQANGIPFKYGGPVEKGYSIPIGDKIEYLGILDEQTKLDFTRRAAGYVILHNNWEVPFSLSFVEALSNNTPIITTPCGFIPSLIQNGINGFMIQNEGEFLSAVKNISLLDQKKIYDSSLPYSEENMLESFARAFKEIIKNET